MSTIKAFQAVYPNPKRASAVICTIEEMSLDTAKYIRSHNPYSFIHLLIPEANHNLGPETKEEFIFTQIKNNLRLFFDNGTLVQSASASIYIYRLSLDGIDYTGVWVCTHIDDYASGILKTHENIGPKREQQLEIYLENSGIDANPVLITYRFSDEINKLITEIVKTTPMLQFRKSFEKHSIWKITDSLKLKEFTKAFYTIERCYLADGHHRLAAAEKYALKRRKEYTAFTGQEEFNYFSSVYISDDQIGLYSFNILIRDLKAKTKKTFLADLKTHFHVSEFSIKLPKDEEDALFLYFENQWYKLLLKEDASKTLTKVGRVSSSVLRKLILEPILKIKHAETDKRLHLVSGKHSLSDLVKRVDEGEFDLVFIPVPISIHDLMEVADSGERMPPKSTWFEPKFPVGLLTHLI